METKKKKSGKCKACGKYYKYPDIMIDGAPRHLYCGSCEFSATSLINWLVGLHQFTDMNSPRSLMLPSRFLADLCRVNGDFKYFVERHQQASKIIGEYMKP